MRYVKFRTQKSKTPCDKCYNYISPNNALEYIACWVLYPKPNKQFKDESDQHCINFRPKDPQENK